MAAITCMSDDLATLHEQIETKLITARSEEEELRSKLYMSWAPDMVKSDEMKEIEHSLTIVMSRIAALERALEASEEKEKAANAPDAGCLSACVSPFAEPDPSTDVMKAALAVTPVWLHVYDVGHAKVIQNIDKVVRDWLGVGGVFHGAVEVFGHEWSFGATRKPVTGVFCCPPKGCPMHTYRQSIYMGDCAKTPQEVHEILKKMMDEWQGRSYDLLRKNCCSFSDEFCKTLGVGPIPKWVHRLADAGAALGDEEKLMVHRLHVIEDEISTDSHLMVGMLQKHKANPTPPVPDA